MSVFSKNWYLIEALKPRLRPQVSVSPQYLRGENHYALKDPVSGAIQLYTAEAYQVIGLMDGQRSLNDIWLTVGDILKDEMPSQEEVLSLVSSLYQMDLLYLDVPSNASDLFKRRDKKKEKKQLQRIYSPLSLQLPLFDPSRLLDFLCPLLDRILGLKAWLVYLAVVFWGVVVALQNLDELSSGVIDRVLAADNLFLLWILYPVIKIFHELGHAYAVRRYGGQVHEVGVMFLVFFPMPYVNASESAAFSNKYHRIKVAAAGLIVELLIAAVAIILWSKSADDFAKSMFYNIAFMAGISTLLFNGNPLLKFDAYYVLSDWIEIPNLAKRGVSYWGYLCKKYLFFFREIDNPAQGKREALWLFFYNLFAFIYRIIISVSIIIFVASQYFVVGVLLGIWTFASGWLIPFVKTFSLPFREREFVMQGRRPKLSMLLYVAAFICLLFIVPLPYSYTASGVVWLQENQRVVAGESGFVESVAIAQHKQVQSGQLLLSLKNPELEHRVAEVSAQLAEAQARLRSVFADRSKVSMADAELRRFKDELVEVKQALERTQVYAPLTGQLVAIQAEKLSHRFVKRGELLAYILADDSGLSVKVLVPEQEAEKVLSTVTGVSLRAASARNQEYLAELSSVVPRVSSELPSAILSQQGGGDITLDPSSKSELATIESFVIVDVINTGLRPRYVNERIYVKFSLAPEPIAYRWVRKIRQVFLEQFDV